MKGVLHQKHIIWAIVLFFLLLLAPWALEFLLFFPDENHYSDGAMYMMEYGEYFSPHRADGSLRFNKPIFNYWVVLGSYQLFGVSEWSTRLPFLLCGGLILLLVFQIGKELFEDQKKALLSVLVMAANPLFSFTVTKSITDTYLLLFVTLTMYGVIGVLHHNGKQIPKKFLWAIYVGCGLAAVTKGIPAVVFTAIGGLFLLLNPWKRYSFLQLFHFPSLLLGIFLSIFWYLVIYKIHGQTAIDEFYGDQVGERFEMTLPHFLQNFGGMILATLVCFFPFVFLLFNKVRNVTKSEQAILGFGMVYYGLLLVMASFTASFYYRYLLQGFTVLAVVISLLLVKKINQHQKAIGISNRILSILVVFLSAATLFNAWVFKANILQVILFVAGLILIYVFFRLLSTKDTLHQVGRTALLMTSIFWVAAAFVKPISQPGMGEQIVESTRFMGIDLSKEKVKLYCKQQPGGKFRVATKGKVFIPHQTETSIEEIPENTYVIFRKGIEENFDTLGIQRKRVAQYWGDLPYDKVIIARLNGKYEQVREENATQYEMVWRE